MIVVKPRMKTNEQMQDCELDVQLFRELIFYTNENTKEDEST